MTAERVVQVLLEEVGLASTGAFLGEASVHRPRRGRLWVAAFRDEHGQPVWRTTGLADREAAQAMADKWEADAKRQRVAQGVQPSKPSIRIRAGSGESALGQLTQKEVAVILRISERAVRAIERRAIAKLRNHPALKQIWREWQGHAIEEAGLATGLLTPAEIQVVLALARTPFERKVVVKLLRIAQS